MAFDGFQRNKKITLDIIYFYSFVVIQWAGREINRTAHSLTTTFNLFIVLMETVLYKC